MFGCSTPFNKQRLQGIVAIQVVAVGMFAK
jgi:hypothetical protein